MKKKGRRAGKRAGRRLASLLLALAMTVGMMSGPVFVKQTAQAAGGGTIELGTKESHGTYYVYPNASVQMTNENQSFYDMSVMVDSGYFKIPYVEMDGVTGTGILSDGKMDKFDKFDQFQEDSTANKYSALTFSWINGISKAKIEAFIRSLQFVTAESQNQVVSISATTLNTLKKQVELEVDGNKKKVQLYYFDGHFYGYVDTWKTWAESYTLAKQADFHGLKGYLATVTSRAEDRFVLNVGWDANSKYSRSGWMGCTRAELNDYNAEVPTWKELAKMPSDETDVELPGFIWRWADGPEAGQRFGWQNLACGSNHDGGFVTDAGAFSNWKSKGDTEGGEVNNAEPNGGGSVNTQEAFGYYGRYEEGRWNDNPNNDNKGAYIEFGGNPGDDEALKKAEGEVIYSVEKDSEGTITDGTDGKEALTGKPYIENKDPYQNCKAGTELEADITEILAQNKDWNLDPDKDLSYQWMRQEKNGVPTPIDGAASKTYNLVNQDLGNKMIVRVTVEKDGQIYYADSDPYNTTTKDSDNKKTAIGGTVAVKETGKDESGDPVLSADISGVTPEGVKPVLDYQWYVYDPSDPSYPYKPISGATEPTYTVPEEYQGKQIAVGVTPNKETGVDYEGTLVSTPYSVPEKNTQKEPIKGVVTINNLTTADDGKTPINKEGTILSADVSGVTPEGSQPTLTYQWYRTDDEGKYQKIPGAVDKNYILTEDDIDRKLAVTAFADEEKYTGSVSSVPYDAARTNAGINVEPDPDVNSEERIIKITPTAQSTGYIVWELGTENEPTYEHYRVTDKDGNPVEKNAEGYYYTSPGEEIWFYVEKDKAYDIKEKQTINTVTETLGIHIDDDKIKETYDDNTDTINITVDPAEKDYQYAILKKIDGKYEPVTVTRDSEGNYVYDPNGSQVWTDGNDGKVDFTKLPADGTYRVVAIPNTLEDGSNPDDIDPSTVNDGSKEIDASKYPTTSAAVDDPKTSYDPTTDTITITVDPAKTDYQYAILKKVNGQYQKVTLSVDANGNYVYDEKGNTIWSAGNQGLVTYTNLPADGTYRIVAVPKTTAANKDISPDQMTSGGSKDIDGAAVKASSNGQNAQYTKAEEDKAEKFIKDYVTDTKKKLITKVDDSTRDIIISGESTWKKMTAREKAAVNAKLKERGCPYTYEQLLAMAKKWKIPSFNMKKVMKKGTKSKIKMVKCSGATIITTTSNKKVGTISKKGVIKAKKVGKAKLTITAIKGKYTNRLVIRLVVRKKFKNAKEIKNLKAKQIKTPTLLLNKRRKVGKSTKVGIVDLNKKSKVKYKSFNTKNFTISKKGRYKAKRLGSSLIRTTVKQNNKTYILYLYLTGTKK